MMKDEGEEERQRKEAFDRKRGHDLDMAVVQGQFGDKNIGVSRI